MLLCQAIFASLMEKIVFLNLFRTWCNKHTLFTGKEQFISISKFENWKHFSILSASNIAPNRLPDGNTLNVTIGWSELFDCLSSYLGVSSCHFFLISYTERTIYMWTFRFSKTIWSMWPSKPETDVFFCEIFGIEDLVEGWWTIYK